MSKYDDRLEELEKAASEQAIAEFHEEIAKDPLNHQTHASELARWRKCLCGQYLDRHVLALHVAWKNAENECARINADKVAHAKRISFYSEDHASLAGPDLDEVSPLTAEQYEFLRQRMRPAPRPHRPFTRPNGFTDAELAAMNAREPNPLADAADQFFRQKFRHVYEQREHLCEAWIAETGLLPSESVLCTQDEVQPSGTVVTRCWVERKRETDRVR